MSFFSPLLLILTAAFLCAIYRTSLHPLANVPGPRVARISGLWRSWHFLRGDWHEEVLNLHKRYGRVVRIAPNELSIMDHNINQKLYGRGCISKKTSWYNVWVPNPAAPGMFATQDEKQHAFLRKRVAKAYSMSTILSSEADIQSCLDDLVQKLGDCADESRITNMSFWTAALAFDVVGKLTLGAPLGMVATATDVMNLARNTFQVFATVTNLGHFPGQGAILHSRVVMRLMSLLGIPNPMADFKAWSMSRIEERIESHSLTTSDDMLAHFLAMKNDTKSNVSVEEVLMEVMIAVGAGADTVASGMRSCLLYISSHPETYQQVQREVDTLDNASMTYSKVQSLPYLCAACHEAMRLLPPIVFPLPRRTSTDLDIEAYRIPAGTIMSTSPGAQNKDPAVFGPDVDCFRPQRWLDDRSLAQKVMTFGGDGPRNCIGQNLAVVEIYLFIAHVMRNFEVALADPASPWRITSYWIAYQSNMMVELTRRNDQQRVHMESKAESFPIIPKFEQ